MTINFSAISARISMLALILLCLSSQAIAATLFEDFDNPSATGTNNGVKITYNSGDWFSFGITKPSTPNEGDRINGLYSLRMRGLANKNTLYMMFDKAGAGVVSFNYGSYSNHSGGKFKLQKSVNAGVTWTDVSTEVTVPAWSGTFLTFSVVVNEPANVRFKLVMTETTNANQQVSIDDFMVTDYNADQTAIPQMSVATGVYESPQTVSISSATPGAVIYFTTDGTPATAASSVYSTALNISQTTRIRAIAVSDGKVNSREEVLLISFPETVTTLAEFYNKLATSGTNPTYFKYTGEAVITFTYSTTTNNRYYFFQDATAGIILNDNFKKMVNTYNIGDKISGLITQVNNVNSSPQLYPYNEFTLISTGNNIVPPVITLADVPNKNNQLVQINNLYFDEADGTKTFNPNTNYVIHDESLATTTTAFRTPASMSVNFDYNATIIPEKVNMICLIAKNSSVVTSHILFARNAAELNVQSTDIHTPAAGNIKITGKTVIFESSDPQKVRIYNVSGQLLNSFTTNTGVNKLELEKGVYFISIDGRTAKVLL